ncbi:menaquinone biosynthesis protein [Thermosulfurimonas marina]|uniref:Chorismate dehydratase n=1 Tax=Thermosulfurimonas marina TaxID=2047767 RepID=A0A6H1WRK2_9BACT|nr:menaquinone biosynthesis protein [Thermosulfurimonas marina]QJA05798.1 menaquinone biosynthesis protein [Thermosulfurimonas marina]
MARFRLGLVRYLNTAALRQDLASNLPPEVELLYASPAELARGLLSGELEAGLVPSVLYARHPQKFLLLPDLSISASGRVGSVLFFYRGDLRELSGKTVALTPESETSVALLRILLEDFQGVRPRYVRGGPGGGAWGYLAIGDEALRLRKSPPFPGVLDLAGIWMERTGLPFVFAVLALRREVLAAERGTLREVAGALYLSRARGVAQLSEVARERPRELSLEEAQAYLLGLEYDLSGVKQEALRVFYQHLARRGEIPSVPEFRFVDL